MRASAVIPTFNRTDELATCLHSLAKQTVPLDVLVMDDGPGEGVKELVEQCYPGARYFHLASRKGPAFQRTEGVERAKCEFVFPFDDDTELPDATIVERTLADFSDPRVAAVAMPFVNVRISPDIHQAAPDRMEAPVVHAFVGAAHALRRSVFLEVGGYNPRYFYMGEEGDLCIRLLERGYVVKLGSAPPLLHFESPRRDSRMAATCGRKNDLLFAWQNVPFPQVVPHMVASALKGALFALRQPHPGWHFQGMLQGVAEMLNGHNPRRPVSVATYRAFRRLKKSGPLPMAAV